MEAAGRLFQERGYHRVSMEEIAQRVGIRGPALYRHFRNKQDILAHVVLGQISVTASVVEAAANADGTSRTRFDKMTEDLARLVLTRDEAMLWRWERRNLAQADVSAYRARARQLEAAVASVVSGLRPEAPAADVELLSWAVLSVFAHSRGLRSSGSSGGHDAPAALLRRFAAEVVRVPLAEGGSAEGVPPIFRAGGRRERIIEAATQLFADRGFVEVSMEDIAAESDAALATIYQNFDSKGALLAVILRRAMAGLNYTVTHRLAGLVSPESRLAALLGLYVELALGPHGRTFGIFDQEVVMLGEGEREDLLVSYRGHVDQWVAVLREVRPELGSAEARARVRSALGLAADIAQTPRLRARATLHQDLVALMSSLLRV
ncbi:TetR/AcrR family transcriptional regulator [Nocardia brevicatena]|uniref:TetR/AcrR family transcriptional regulator n=1 Tax=Nocardia brevicatena TaxID=37327 RepID=UPI000304C3C5|nr:TetR family transcriptional regulator [Nocardia brevicatena]